MNDQGGFLEDLVDIDKKLLEELRSVRRNARLLLRSPEPDDSAVSPLSRGQRIADAVARTMGSWRFIIIQSTLLAAWVTLNVTAWRAHWDPYPFILLNLALSFKPHMLPRSS